MNTSKAIAEIIEIAKNLSKADSDDLKKKLKKELLFSAKLLGILQDSPDKWLGIGKTDNNLDSDKIEKLVQLRNEARAALSY